MSYSLRTLFNAALSATLIFSPLASASATGPLWFEHTDIQLPARTTVAQLNNGLRYIVLPTTKSSDEVSIRVRVNSGVAQEPSDLPLSRIAALNTIASSDWLATSGYQQTVFSLDLSHATSTEIDSSLAFIRAGLVKPQQPGTDLIEVAQHSLTDIDQSVTSNELQAFAANQHWQPLSEASLTETPARSVTDFQTRHYLPNKVTVVIAGGVEPRKAIKLIENNFANWQRDAKALAQPLPQIDVDSFSHQSLTSDNALSISRLKTIQQQPDSKRQRKETLMLTLANTLLQQRIEHALQQRNSNAKVAVESQLIFSNQLLSQVRLTELEANEKDSAEQIVQAEIKRAISSGFTQTEYEMVVSQVRQQLRNQTHVQNSHYTAQQADRLISAINSGSVYTAPSYDLDLLNFHVAHLNELDVTKELSKVWSQDNAVVM